MEFTAWAAVEKHDGEAVKGEFPASVVESAAGAEQSSPRLGRAVKQGQRLNGANLLDHMGAANSIEFVPVLEVPPVVESGLRFKLEFSYWIGFHGATSRCFRWFV